MTRDASVRPVLCAPGVSKRYGSVVALGQVDFEVVPGEVVALIGDNGAGKSTLTKILAGAIVPDTGPIEIDGARVTLNDPRDAHRLGIETVYQDLALAPDLDIAANLFLGRELRRPGILGAMNFFDNRAMQERAEEHLRDFGIGVTSIRQRVDSLSGGQRQSIAVARSVLWGRRVVLMDEPTAALGVVQAALVLQLIRRVSEAGIAVVLVSHNLPHVFEIAHRVVVLRQGVRVGTLDPKDASMDQAVGLMTGASVAAAS